MKRMKENHQKELQELEVDKIVFHPFCLFDFFAYSR